MVTLSGIGRSGLTTTGGEQQRDSMGRFIGGSGAAGRGGVHIVMLPEELIKAAITDGPLWRLFGERMGERARIMCPVSRGNLGEAAPGPHLKDNIFVRFEYGGDPRIQIGSSLARPGKGKPNALALIELGTPSHIIPGNPILSFKWRKLGNAQVFFASVKHPGTVANPFVTRAVQQIVHESGGAAFVK